MAKYSEMKAESFEKLNCSLASETARKTKNSCIKRIVCIRVSNNPFDNENSLYFLLTTTTNLKGLNLFSATYFSPLFLTSIVIFSFIQDLVSQILVNMKFRKHFTHDFCVTNALRLRATCLHKVTYFGFVRFLSENSLHPNFFP